MRVARSGGRSPQSDDGIGDTESAGQLRGAGSGGWARGLVTLGAGGYYEGAADGYAAALRGAAKAIRSTGRPVGMIVWRGKHAWVMTGFTATGDPLTDPEVPGDRRLRPGPVVSAGQLDLGPGSEAEQVPLREGAEIRLPAALARMAPPGAGGEIRAWCCRSIRSGRSSS